jgi:signal recognition particle subunit SRP54
VCNSRPPPPDPGAARLRPNRLARILRFDDARLNLTLPSMFDSLSGKLQNAFRNLRGLGKITEANISDALREVRMALLDADVHFKVARDFIERVKQKSLGQEVLQSIQPGQQIIKMIQDELVELLGSTHAELALQGHPVCLLMVGLHGSGKTTSSGKLARFLQKQGRQPLLVAADVYRPAAMDQLETLGRKLDLPVFLRRGETDVLKLARDALAFAGAHQRNTLIFDTAGRLQIDEPLVQELVHLRDLVHPQEILLVLDAATGQEAVHVATHFDQALQITGAILTKLDGDARGGAALSLRAVTGKPIKFVGVGEKLEDFEPFHPERMASRILGMGDVVSLVEKAAETVDLDEARRLEEKMRKGQFTLEDFLDQLRQMKKLGPLESLIGLLPGGAEALQQADLSSSEKEFRRMEAMICAMTPQERRQPQILNASRRRRIAKGSGVEVSDLNLLLNRFGQMQQMMKKMGKFQRMMARMGPASPRLFRR